MRQGRNWVGIYWQRAGFVALHYAAVTSKPEVADDNDGERCQRCDNSRHGAEVYGTITWGGSTCPHCGADSTCPDCGAETDKWGRELKPHNAR
jgi:hypothetical protein